MTEHSTKTYILYKKTIIRGRNVLVQNLRGRNVRERNVQSKKSVGETSRSKYQAAKCPGPKNVGGEASWSETSESESPGAKTLSEPSLHDCETFSMIVTVPEASLWLWGSFIIII